MNHFTKIVRIGTQVEVGDTFIHIKFKDGRLSISGVEGPKPNGDAHGGCGQIDMHEWAIHRYAPGWDAAAVAKLREIWKNWHLNDMTPNCEHQTGPEWTPKKIKFFEVRLTSEALNAQSAARAASRKALEQGETFTPTPEQVEANNRKYSLNLVEGSSVPEGYQPSGKTETKQTNWLSQSEHPEGYLSKPCPVCGYKYGSAWLKREVPEEVLLWLLALPDTDIKPAWV